MANTTATDPQQDSDVQQIQDLQQIIQLQQQKMKQFNPESGLDDGMGLSRLTNVLPGMGRAVMSHILDNTPQNGQKGLEQLQNPPQTQDLVSRLKTAISGKYPPSSQLYNVDPATGFVMDMAQDPTGPVLSTVASLGVKGVRGAANAGINALRESPEAAQALPTSNLPTMRERLSGYLQGIKNYVGSPEAAGDAASTPVGSLLERTGQKVYGSRLGKLDDAVGPGLPPPSESLLHAGVVTTKGGLADRIQSRLDFLEGKNDEIISKAQSLPSQNVQQSLLPGVVPPATQMNTVNVTGVADKLRAFLKPYSKLDGFSSTISSLEPELARLDQAKNISLDEAVELKSKAKELASAAYSNADATLKPQFYRAFRQELSNAMGDAISKISPDTAKLYRANNMEMGSLINALPQAQAMGKSTLARDIVGDVAAGGAGLLFTHDPMSALKAVVAKRAVQSAISPGITTGTGWALNRAGQILQKPGAEAALRQAVVHSGSPWTLFNDKPDNSGNLK